jgi:four helix bundle protein
MTPDQLKARTKAFALTAARFAKRIPRDPINNIMTSQLARAATGTAAAYRAVCRARSRADFINKLGNAIEEVDEASLWLELLEEMEACPRAENRPTDRGSGSADEDLREVTRNRPKATEAPRLVKNRQPSIHKESTVQDRRPKMVH